MLTTRFRSTSPSDSTTPITRPSSSTSIMVIMVFMGLPARSQLAWSSWTAASQVLPGSNSSAYATSAEGGYGTFDYQPWYPNAYWSYTAAAGIEQRAAILGLDQNDWRIKLALNFLSDNQLDNINMTYGWKSWLVCELRCGIVDFQLPGNVFDDEGLSGAWLDLCARVGH